MAVTLTPGLGSLNVTWTLPTGAYGGYVEHCLAGTRAWVAEANAYRSFTITGLATNPTDVRVVFSNGSVSGVVTGTPGSPPPPPPSGVTVNAVPSGPPLPSSGWTCVLADGFNGAVNPILQSALWFPGRDSRITLGQDEPGDNPNELQVYNSSQVLNNPAGAGVILRQTYGARPSGKNYVSGTIRSWVGAQGRKGFSFLPGNGQTIVFESVISCPVNPPLGGGNDLGWWALGPTWKDEIDFFEQFGSDPTFHADPLPPIGYAWIYNTSTGGSVGGYSRVPQGFDGLPHRWTTQISPDLTTRLWIDGAPQTWFGTNGVLAAPPSISTEPLALTISWALRIAAPGFVSGSRDVPVKSVAVYQDSAHAGVGITGGGIAPGTTLS